MTSALAAAMRELDRSRERLEQEMSQNPDYAALRDLDRSPNAGAPTAAQQRQVLLDRLESLPLYQALQGLIAANAHISGTGQGEVIAAIAAETMPVGAAPIAAPPIAGSPSAAPPRPRPAFAPPDRPAQPLTAIRGITPAISKELQAMGIVRYEQIADWRTEDVRDVAAALELGRTISQRNWIEQAALLAMRAPEGWRPAGPDKAQSPSLPPAPIEAPTGIAVQPAPELRIPELLSLELLNPELLDPVQPSPVLLEPLFAAEPVPAPAPKPVPPGYSEMLRIVAGAATAALTGAATAHVDPSPPWPTAVTADSAAPDPRPADPLHHIHGIDGALAQRLAEVGIGHFSIIAGWRAADLAAIASQLDVSAGRINREGWIEQAAILAAGRETAFSRRLVHGEESGAAGAGDIYPPLYHLSPSAPARVLVAIPTSPPEVAATVGAAPAPLHAPAAILPTLSMRIGERPSLQSTSLPSSSLQSSSLKADDSVGPDHDEPSNEDVPESPLERISNIDRSLSRLIDEELAMSAIEEATVTFIARPLSLGSHEHSATASIAPAEKPKPAPPIFRPPPRPARPAYGHPLEDEPLVQASEEAAVEIIRRDDPSAPSGGGAAAKAVINRPLPTKTALHRETIAPGNQQPAWIAEKKDEAGGVVRRFLKAIKRNA